MARKRSAPRAQARRRKKKKREGPGATGGILVVNMIPRSLSRESNQDSEPMIAVHPANPLEIVGTAFTPDPAGGSNAPLYVSTDGGRTWRLHSIVPSRAGSLSGTNDITVAFAGAGGTLYGGILRDPSVNFETLRAASPHDPATMEVLQSRAAGDQPFVHAITNAGKDRVLVGVNDFGAGSATATVDASASAGIAKPSFRKVRIETRPTMGQDGPQVRPVSHADGTSYAAFYGWRSESGEFTDNTLVVTTDVVVVRDDRGLAGTRPFQDLKDAGDGLSGRLVARAVQVPFHQRGTAATGQQRLGGTLSIAVDPRAEKSGTVYLAWGDRQPGSVLTLHVRRSTDRGATWSAADLLAAPNATNAALAINGEGVVGLLYQEVTGAESARRWVTHFRRSADGARWDDVILADTPADVPAKIFDPYLGDYDHLVAVGADFFGIFCASNTPDPAHFPSGVTWQRNVDLAARRLLALDGKTPVPVSIDPFFFKTTA
ncbi:MAG TPA: hypothetical protein VGK89_02585 [Candidatus Eisenbacteria bacterium]|jgi:hypothetical protein